MPDTTATGRKPESAVRRPRALERLVVVAAVAAVLVSVGAWIALNRPDGAAEAAATSSSSATAIRTSDPVVAAAPSTASAVPDPAAAPSATTAGDTPPPAPTAAPAPTGDFLAQLAASGLEPPVDDTQKLDMAQDVCQRLGNGSTYDDVVRALTVGGATDEQAANFTRLAITNVCPMFTAG